MIDRTQFEAQGLEGGQPGALGEFRSTEPSSRAQAEGAHERLADGERRLQPKTVIWFEPATRVHLNPPGGGGYGDPFERDPERVLDDVVNGYVSVEAAERDYGVVVRYLGGADRLVRLPEHYIIDWPATKQLRRRHNE